MIQQQVDFYRPHFRPKRDFLAARNLLSLIFLLVLLVIASHLLMQRHLQTKRAEVRALPGVFSTIEIAVMESENRCKKEMLAVLGVYVESGGFLALLRGFSQGAVSGVWLTGVGLFERGREMVLRGRSDGQAPERIATYARGLSKVPVFAQSRIQFYQVSEDLDKKNGVERLNFCLDSRQPKKNDGSGTETQSGCTRLALPLAKN